MPLTAVSASECARLLGHDADPRLVRHALRVHAMDSAAESSEAEDVFALDQVKVAVFQAHQLLRTSPRMTETEFLGNLASRVPGDPLDKAKVKSSVLRGVALVEDAPTKNTGAAPGVSTVSYFPEEALPASPDARFQQLFARRARWTRTELEPYLERLTGPGVTVDALLLRYARTVVESGSGQDAGADLGTLNTFYSAR